MSVDALDETTGSVGSDTATGSVGGGRQIVDSCDVIRRLWGAEGCRCKRDERSRGRANQVSPLVSFMFQWL